MGLAKKKTAGAGVDEPGPLLLLQSAHLRGTLRHPLGGMGVLLCYGCAFFFHHFIKPQKNDLGADGTFVIDVKKDGAPFITVQGKKPGIVSVHFRAAFATVHEPPSFFQCPLRDVSQPFFQSVIW